MTPVLKNKNYAHKTDATVSNDTSRKLESLKKGIHLPPVFKDFISSEDFSAEILYRTRSKSNILANFNTALETIQKQSSYLSTIAYPKLVERFEKLGETEEDLNKTLTYCSKSPLIINVNASSIPKIHEDGFYRSHTRGYSYCNHRVQAEQEMFPNTYIYNYIRAALKTEDLDYTTFIALGPIYGSLNAVKSRKGVTNYGNIIFVIQDHLRYNVTLYPGDSIDGRGKKDFMGTLDNLCHLLNSLSDNKLQEIIDRALDNRLGRPEYISFGDYIETQIHTDRLDLKKDIKKIVLSRDDYYTDTQLKQCLELSEKYSIPLVWHGSVETNLTDDEIKYTCQKLKWHPKNWVTTDHSNYLVFKKSTVNSDTSYKQIVVRLEEIKKCIEQLVSEHSETSIAGLHIDKNGHCTVNYNTTPYESIDLSIQKKHYFELHTCKNIKDFLQTTEKENLGSVQAHASHEGLYYVITKISEEQTYNKHCRFQEINNAVSLDAAVSHIEKNFGEIASTAVCRTTNDNNAYSFIYTPKNNNYQNCVFLKKKEVNLKDLRQCVSGLKFFQTASLGLHSLLYSSNFIETSILSLEIDSNEKCTIKYNVDTSKSTDLPNQEKFYFELHTCEDIQKFQQGIRSPKTSIQAHAFHKGLHYVITKISTKK